MKYGHVHTYLHRKTCTTHNNISPYTNDGVINSPVAWTSFLLSFVLSTVKIATYRNQAWLQY